MARGDLGAGDWLVVGEALPWVLGNRVIWHLSQGNRGAKCKF